jgi:farnesyl-diphosphate farnesyltransferase
MESGQIEFCFDILPEVSRTFALSISQLKDPLRSEVCVAYLICRILDTIEDSPTLTIEEKEFYIGKFIRILEEESLKNELFFKDLSDKISQSSAISDVALVENGEEVTSSFFCFKEESKRAISPWVEEMGKGMIIYSKKMFSNAKIYQIKTFRELEEYCYYIAGTVGFMLTNLFKANCKEITEESYRYLKERANDFGLALQKVNILKDIRDDLKRGWCFLPEEILSKRGIKVEDISKEENGALIFDVLSPLFESLRKDLKSGFEYLIAIPKKEKEIRLFLSTSLFFASSTVDLLIKKKREFLSEAKLKISRLQVAQILYQLEKKCTSNEKLQRLWDKMNGEFEKALLPFSGEEKGKVTT